MKISCPVLLVDDSEMMLGYITALLQGRGLNVLPHRTLADGLSAYVSARPKAVLTDFVLEGATGLDLLSAIFAVAGAHRPKAAILTQGELSLGDRAKAENWGIAVFQKPKRGQEDGFLKGIDDWLSQKA